MSNQEEIIKSEGGGSESKPSVAPNPHKKVQTAEGWKRSIKRTRKSSKTTSKG